MPLKRAKSYVNSQNVSKRWTRNVEISVTNGGFINTNGSNDILISNGETGFDGNENSQNLGNQNSNLSLEDVCKLSEDKTTQTSEFGSTCYLTDIQKNFKRYSFFFHLRFL